MHDKKDLRSLLSVMEKDWETYDKAKLQHMWKDVKLVRFMVKFSLCSTMGSVITHTACRLLVTAFSKNEASNDTNARLLLLSSEFFYDTEKSPNYEITWISQFIASSLGAFAFSNLDGFFIFTIFHLCAQLRILKLDIQNLVAKSKKKLFISELRPIIQRHLELKG